MESKLCLLLIVSVASVVPGQMILPARPPGFVYDSLSATALVHLDVHLCPMFPESAAALPVMKQVADHYGPGKLKLTLHIYPLPFHYNAFAATIGAHVFRALSGDQPALPWIEKVYQKIDTLSNTATAELTAQQTINQLSEFAEELGIPSASFLEEFVKPQYNRAARAAWKYSASRGVHSTPTFFLNDVTIGQADSTWNLQDWVAVIDSLLDGTDAVLGDEQDCVQGTRRCPYTSKHSKVDCCVLGQTCTPSGCKKDNKDSVETF